MCDCTLKVFLSSVTWWQGLAAWGGLWCVLYLYGIQRERRHEQIVALLRNIAAAKR